MSPESRPNVVKDEHLAFLDEVRASGAINMFTAAPYLRDVFGLSRKDSHAVLGYWMETFESHQLGGVR